MKEPGISKAVPLSDPRCFERLGILAALFAPRKIKKPTRLDKPTVLPAVTAPGAPETSPAFVAEKVRLAGGKSSG